MNEPGEPSQLASFSDDNQGLLIDFINIEIKYFMTPTGFQGKVVLHQKQQSKSSNNSITHGMAVSCYSRTQTEALCEHLHLGRGCVLLPKSLQAKHI